MSYGFPGGASPVMQHPFPQSSPQPQTQQIQPGSITYTTTMGADGQVTYHPFRAVPASYQTPQGIVSGIQWIPAEATQVLPAGATPAGADLLASFSRGQDGRARDRDWQREEDRRRKTDDKSRNSLYHGRDRDRDEEYELRKAREKDARTERERDRLRERRASNAGYGGAYPDYERDLERRFQDLDVDHRDRDRDYERDRGARSRRGSTYGERPAGYQPAPGGNYSTAGYSPATSAYSTTATAGYPTSTSPYAGASGGQYPVSTAYPPPSPRMADAVGRPVSPYRPAGGMQGSVSPYQAGAGIQRSVSPYQAGAGIQRSVSPYQAGAGIQRSVSPYQAGVGIQRSSSPFYPGGIPRAASPYQSSMVRAGSPLPGAPGVYPPGHIMEGQPIRSSISRIPSPSPMPVGNVYGSAGGGVYGAGTAPYGAAGAGYPSAGAGTFRGPNMSPEQPPQPMLSVPEGFSRPPNLAQPYTHFEMMKIQDMEDFLEVIPRMPLVLVPHDVYHEDWIRLMNDLSLGWSGRLPVPEYSRDGRPPKRTELTADVIDLWNASFFIRRGVELVLYKGRERRSGRNIGQVDMHLPGFDTYDVSSPSESDTDDNDGDDGDRDRPRYGAYGGVYGRQTEPEVREARRIRRERKAERKKRKMEKKIRRKVKEMDRNYALYLTCVSNREGGGL